MGEGGDADVVGRLEAERSGIGLRRVGLALVGELLRHLAEVGVEDSDESLQPGVGKVVALLLGVAGAPRKYPSVASAIS